MSCDSLPSVCCFFPCGSLSIPTQSVFFSYPFFLSFNPHSVFICFLFFNFFPLLFHFLRSSHRSSAAHQKKKKKKVSY
jgi:hypothetical protein